MDDEIMFEPANISDEYVAWLFSDDDTANPTEGEKGSRLIPLTVRLNANAYEAIRSVASENHLSAAELVRLAIDGKIGEYLGTLRFVDYEQGEEIHKAIRELYTEISKVKFEINKIGVNYNQTVKNQNAILKNWEKVWEEKSGQLNTAQKMQMQLQKESIIKRMELDRATLDKAIQKYIQATKEVAKLLCHILM